MYYHSVAKCYKGVSHCSPSHRMPLSRDPPSPTNLKNQTTAMQEIHTLILPCPQPFYSSAMSAMALAEAKSLHKKPAHRRDISDELDVFEAAGYYSGIADAASFRSGITSHRAMKEERYAMRGGGERRSLDVPMRGPLPLQSHKAEKQTKDKKSKQPISPGGRLASFLNSFFHQGSSKKKSKSTTTSATQSCKDEDEKSPGGRRKRRSSISHSHSIRSGKSSSLVYSSGSGFRTPPPGKANEDVRTYQGTKCNGQPMPGSSCLRSEVLHEGRSSYGDLPRERSRRVSTNGIFLEKGGGYYGKSVSDAATYGAGFSEKASVLNKDGKGMACKDLLRADESPPKERNLWRREEEDDGGESDSSSDLFELPNYHLGHLSTGLPVYETTSLVSIRRGSPITSVIL